MFPMRGLENEVYLALQTVVVPHVDREPKEIGLATPHIIKVA